MAAGQLRQRVTFERRDVADDGGGGGSVHWTAALVVWGALMPERGREALEAGRLESASMAVLKIRSSVAVRAIDASWRATIDGVAYQIRSIVNPDQHNKYLEMIVQRGVAS